MAQTDRSAGLVGSASVKGPCRTATTASITLSGLQSAGGVTVAAEDRVLVRNQANAVENGIYLADTGDWTRAKDANGAHDLVNGSLTYVTDGTEAGWYYLAGATNPVAIGTAALTFSRAGTTLATISAFAQTVIDDTSATEFKQTLGLDKSGADVAAAATIDLDAVAGDFVDVTGTTTITAITLSDGVEKVVRFAASLTLTNGASLSLPNAANIKTAAGDVAIFRGDSGGVVRCISFQQLTRLGADVASATALPLGATAGRVFDVTGTTTITSITSKGVGSSVLLQFDGALELTHSANLVLPGAVNHTTTAGDLWRFYEYASGQWRGAPLAQAIENYRTTVSALNMQASGRRLGFEVIASGSVAAVASLDFVDLTSAYRAYLLAFDDALPATDGQVLNLLLSTNNGASFLTGASDYGHDEFGRFTNSTANTVGTTSSAGATAIGLTRWGGNVADAEESAGILLLYNPLSTGMRTLAQALAGGRDTSSNLGHNVGVGQRNAVEANNAFRLIYASGNIATLNYTLYGLRAS